MLRRLLDFLVVDHGHETRFIANGGSSLSPREQEILTLLAEGKTEKQIATALVLSPKTVVGEPRGERARRPGPIA
jgi:DNA-binding NarL/FixJ family response regulator